MSSNDFFDFRVSPYRFIPLTLVRSAAVNARMDEVTDGFDGVKAQLALKSWVNNPVFTGDADFTACTSVTVPDLAITDSTNKAATTEFVQQVVGASESLLPLQTGFVNKVLKTNGTFAYWAGAFETDEALFHRVLLQDNTGYFNIGHPVIAYSTLTATCKEFVLTGSMVCLIPQGSTSVVYTSSDGINWVSRALPAAMSVSVACVRHGTSRIVLSPVSGTAGAVSTDGGVTWSASTLPGAFGDRMASSSSLYAGFDGTIGTYYTSTTGETGSWTARATPMPAAFTGGACFLQHGSNILLAKNGASVYSADGGLSWTTGAAPPFIPTGPKSAAGNGRFALGGNNEIAHSTNGASWSTAVPSANINVQGMCYGDKFVAVGSNGSGQPVASRSTDGITWTTVTVEAATYTLNDVAWNGSTYMAVGGNGTAERAYTSPDGITWTLLATPPSDGTGSLSNIVWDSTNSRWIVMRAAAPSDGYTWHSTNGASWTAIAGSYSGVSDIVFVNGALFQHGSRAYRSTDYGANWTDIDPDENNSPILWTGAFYLLGTSASIKASTDLSQWTEILYSISTLNGCSGGFGANLASSTRYWASTDGLAWGLAQAPVAYSSADFGVDRSVGSFGFLSGSTKYITTNFSTWTSAAIPIGPTTYPSISVNGVLLSGSAAVTGQPARAYVSDDSGVSWREYSTGTSGGYGSQVLNSEVVVFGTKLLAQVGSYIKTFDQTMKGPMYK